MRYRHLTLCVLIACAACAPAIPPPPSQYRPEASAAQMPVVFDPGSADITSPYRARLRIMRRYLPAQAVARLEASGPFAWPRSKVVARLLDRPVQLIAAEPGTPEDQVRLIIYSPSIVADACRGPGKRGLGTIWPSSDYSAERYLPPGCATEASVQTQIVQPYDLLVGRPLPPGASSPFAAAIERYYQRHEQSLGGAAQGGGGGGAEQSTTAIPAAGQGTAGQAAPGLLVGPLPGAGGQGQAAPQGGGSTTTTQ